MSPHNAQAVISVRGADATSFLNSQLTRRVDNLRTDESALAAWCTAKGRVHSLFQVLRTADAYLLQLPASLLPKTLQRLKMFVLRSQVLLEQTEDKTGINSQTTLQQVHAGIPQIYPETGEQFLPQMLNLDLLDGVDFKKGCYPGQEIVARSQYLGQLKRRMYRFSTDSTQQPLPGTSLLSTEDISGTVIDAEADETGQWQLLAVVPIASVSANWHLGDKDGATLRLQSLPYLSV